MHMIDKLVSRCCNIVVRNLLFILFSCENKRSPLQLVTISRKNILVASPTFGKFPADYSAFIREYKAAIFKFTGSLARIFKYCL